MDEKQRYEAGMQVRRAVLGDAHVERSLDNLTEFNGEFQEMITRHAWGDIWTARACPGIPQPDHHRHADRHEPQRGAETAPARGGQQWRDP